MIFETFDLISAWVCRNLSAPVEEVAATMSRFVIEFKIRQEDGKLIQASVTARGANSTALRQFEERLLQQCFSETLRRSRA